MTDQQDATAISVVVPVFNERENLVALIARLEPMLEDAAAGRFEVILVDDGSRDGSSEMLDDFSRVDPRLKTVHLSRNFGHQAALQAGLDATSGEAVLLIDADLQDPPELIPSLVAKWREGYDVVYGIRRQRREGIWKRIAYQVFYRTLSLIADIKTPRDSGDFCLMDRQVVLALRAFTVSRVIDVSHDIFVARMRSHLSWWDGCNAISCSSAT